MEREDVLAEVAGMITRITGHSGQITAATVLEDDLWLESIELAALGELMRQRYGDRVDLPAFLAAQDLDGLIGLTAGDLVALAQQGMT